MYAFSQKQTRQHRHNIWLCFTLAPYSNALADTRIQNSNPATCLCNSTIVRNDQRLRERERERLRERLREREWEREREREREREQERLRERERRLC